MPDAPDSQIEVLSLAEVAKRAAYELKRQHPTVVFTSGRRDKAAQALAMASNVVYKRKWIEETYRRTEARNACQRWVDEHPEKCSVDAIAAGLLEVLDGLPEAAVAQLSKHLSGEAFDVQPVETDAESIKAAIRSLPELTKFLDREGGLDRWHAEF
jgi:hypothetical protein